LIAASLCHVLTPHLGPLPFLRGEAKKLNARAASVFKEHTTEMTSVLLFKTGRAHPFFAVRLSLFVLLPSNLN
jgi:hypothetical protein